MDYKIGDKIGTKYFVVNDDTFFINGVSDFKESNIETKIQEKILSQEDLDSLKNGYITFPSLEDSGKMTWVEKKRIFRC